MVIEYSAGGILMLSRRELIGGTVGLLGFSQAAGAALQCGPYQTNGVRVCEAGLIVDINPILANVGYQERPYWCWAACISAVFGFHGFFVSQSDIVSKVFGSAINSTADGPHIIAGINGDWTDNNGREFTAQGVVLLDSSFGFQDPSASPIAAQELASGRPLIIGAMGHAMILSGMTYAVDVYSRGQPLSLVVRDPWPRPGFPPRRQLSGQEVFNTSFLAGIIISS
jgi:hypothetical protein